MEKDALLSLTGHIKVLGKCKISVSNEVDSKCTQRLKPQSNPAVPDVPE